MRLALPKHDYLRIEINDCRTGYETVAQELARYPGRHDFASQEAKQRAISQNEIVTVYWSPPAVSGADKASAATLEDALAYAVALAGAGPIVESAGELPRAAVAIYIEHNPHRHMWRSTDGRFITTDCHHPPAEEGEHSLTLEEWIEEDDMFHIDKTWLGSDWIDDDKGERAALLAAGEVWTMQWYPHTPVGFSTACAPSFAALLASATA